MVFRRFVEVGRVIIVNYGPLTGKLAVIVDILTTTKVIIQGLKGGVRRQELSLRRVTLTDYKIDIKRGAKREEIFKAIEDYKLEEKFKKSNFAKKNELREKRANLTDFDRFKVMRLRQKRASRSTFTLTSLSNWMRLFTSRMSGMLRMVTASLVSSVAQITCKASFLAPCGVMVPLSVCPPSMMNDCISGVSFCCWFAEWTVNCRYVRT